MASRAVLDLLIQLKGDAEQRLKSFGSTLGDISKNAVAFAAGGLLQSGIESVGSALFGAVKGGIDFNSQMEIVTAKLNAFTKDGAKSAEILAMIQERASKTPFAFGEMADAAAALLPTSKASGAALEELIAKAEILAASNPAEGLEGAAFALKEAVSGDFTSIIERFNLPRQRLKELKEEGVPALEAVQIAMSELGLDADLVSNLAETASGRWSTFKDTLTAMTATATKPIFDILSNGLAKVNEWATANQPLIDAFVAQLAGGLSSAIEWIGTTGVPALTDAWAALQPYLAGAGSLFDQIRAAIEPVIAAFQEEGLSGAVRVLLNSFGSLRSGLLDKVKEALPGVLDFIGAELQRWAPIVATEAGKLAIVFLEWIGPASRDMVIKLGELLGVLLTWIYDNREEIIATLESWASAFGEWATTQGMPALGQALLDAAGGVWNYIKDKWGAAFAPGTLGESLVNSIKQGIANAWEGFKAWFLEMLVSAVPGAGVVLQAAGAGGVAIPGFAGGVTNFRGGLAVVGERGPELVNLPGGSSVIPSGGFGGGVVVHVTVQGSVVTERDLVESVRRGLAETARRNGDALGGIA